ncbi:MAG: oligoendopeptidase F [Pseudomonadota bacterium]
MSPAQRPLRTSLCLGLFASIVVSLPLTVSGSHAAESIPERSEVPSQYRWDLSSMYADWSAWEADVARLPELTEAVTAYKGRLAESGETLLAALKAEERAATVLGNLYVFAGLSSFEDQRNSENGGRFSRSRALSASYNEQTAFFSPELLAIEPQRLDAMIEEAPELAVYRHFFAETSRMRDYTLSEREEQLLAMAADPLAKFSNVFSSLNNADLSFGTVVNEAGERVDLTKSSYGAFLSSEDRRLRKEAWIGLFTEYERLGNTLAANYEGHVKAQIFEAKARGFDSALHAATYSSAIPREVYLNLVAAVKEGAGPLQRYLKLRQQKLGVDQLEIWDLYAPLVEPAYKDLSFEDAKVIVADALAPMGEEYLKLYWFGFDDGWVDAYENLGKRGGAYSWGTYSSKPYLSMNYQGTLSDVSTLAHEYGHSIHSYMTRAAQPQVYGYYTTFVAEVASMTNEALLFQKMLAESEDPLERVYLLQTYLDQFRGGFYRQASFADFEMRAHAAVEAGEALTKDSVNQIYADVYQDFYGDAVNIHPLNASEWSRIPHFMRTDNFYVYQYATSFVAATALAKSILAEGEPARDRFITMLKSGSNDYAIELLKKAGVDMTTPEPVYATIEVFDEMVSELAQALAELEE